MRTDLTMIARMAAVASMIAIACLKLIAADYEETITALTQGQPADVAQFILRRIGCNHWLGEEPFDDDRAKEIQDVIQQLKCQTIEQDEKALQRLHADNARALKAIADARDLAF